MITINDKIEVKNYPYGYKKTSCFFSIEFKDNKGFRMIKQTINPKNGLLNKPKKSTYSKFLYMTNINNFVSYHSMDLYELKDIEKVANFINKNFELFTKEQIEYCYRHFIVYSKITIQSMATYCNSDVKTLLKLFDNLIKLSVKGLKTGENLFSQLSVDIKAIEATEQKDYQPFKIKSYEI